MSHMPYGFAWRSEDGAARSYEDRQDPHRRSVPQELRWPFGAIVRRHAGYPEERSGSRFGSFHDSAVLTSEPVARPEQHRKRSTDPADKMQDEDEHENDDGDVDPDEDKSYPKDNDGIVGADNGSLVLFIVLAWFQRHGAGSPSHSGPTAGLFGPCFDCQERP